MTELRGKPPGPREGSPIWSQGRQVTPGLAPFKRSLSPRASSDDLWASLEASCDEGKAKSLAKSAGASPLERSDCHRYRSFVHQAKEFYTAQRAVMPASKPLPAYYFVLNLSKALLTLAQPDLTASGHMKHGVSVWAGSNDAYGLDQATSKVHTDGVLPLLAARTGARNMMPANNPIGVPRLLPYLAETTDEYIAMSGQLPRLLEIESIAIMQHKGTAWLRVEISKDRIARRGLQPKKLAEVDATLFAQYFDFAGNDNDRNISVFESANPIEGARKGATWRELGDQLDRSLIIVDRTQLSSRRFVTLDSRSDLISYEAVTFIVMHHLSEMVRYRPDHADSLLTSKYGWLLTTWVNRACDNFLLTMASRICDEEHEIRR